MDLLGKKDNEIEDELKILKQLYENYEKPLPIIGEPLIETSY